MDKPLSGIGRRILGLALLLLVLAACHRSSDEERLHQAMDAMERAMESGEAGEFMDFLAEDFTANGGDMDRSAMQRMLAAQALTNAHIRILRTATDIQVNGSRATIQTTVVLEGGSGRWLPERGSSYEITSGWRVDDGEWKCVNAFWERKL